MPSIAPQSSHVRVVLGGPLHEPIDLRPDEEIAGGTSFYYYVDGTPWSLDALDPAFLQDGYHDLRIVAVSRGSEEEIDSVTANFVVDNTAPDHRLAWRE